MPETPSVQDIAELGSLSSRPYRSKKRPPCDCCRRRRVACIVDINQRECTLCRHRGVSCTFESAPPVKRPKRQPLRPLQSVQSSQSQEALQSPRIFLDETATLPPSAPLDSPTILSAPATLDVATPLSSPAAEQSARERGVDRHDSYRTTVDPNRTVLYVGNSSDQDVYLLRHLPFERSNRFGSTNWQVLKVYADEVSPAYFTSYPNALLDRAEDVNTLEEVDGIVEPFQRDLVDLYYRYVHPSLPILEGQSALEATIYAGSVPSTLLGAIYYAAACYWHLSPALQDFEPIPRDCLYELLYRALTLEARTPSLRTIQALLLLLQAPPIRVREPNHPGFWSLTCQLVALAQEVGIHVEPTSWNISQYERKSRRILWWAVYMQDKWLAHWLGRPSHIDDNQYSVLPLITEDFTPGGYLSEDHVRAFVRLCAMAPVLAKEALTRATACQVELSDCAAQQGIDLLRPGQVINDYAFVFAYYGIALSIQRSVFACVGGTSYYDLHREEVLFKDLFQVLEDLLGQNHNGLWLSYCKSNIATVGSFIITALLSSIDDDIYRARKSILDTYRSTISQLADRFEFAALPLLRLNLLLDRFSGNDLRGESP